MKTHRVLGLTAIAVAILVAAGVLAGTQVEAAGTQRLTVRVVNSTRYKVKYTVYDTFGPETGWINPGASKDWTSVHTGKIHTAGSGYDAQGKEVLTWDYHSWDVDNTARLRITLTE